MGFDTEFGEGGAAAEPPRPGAPRVLHIVPTALGRGAQLFARSLVDQLGGARAGHRLVSLFDGPADIEVDATVGWPGGVEAATGLRPRALSRLSRLVARAAPDVVVAHGGDAFKYVALATRVPIVYCVIGTWPAAAPAGRRLAWRALIRRAGVLVAVSDDVAADCRNTLGARTGRVVVVPNGRDPRRYRPAPVGASSPADGPVRMVFVGYLDRGKGPDRFIEMVRSLRADGLPVTGTVVGDGPLRAALEGPAAAAGVELSGRRDDVVPFLQRSDLLVFPSAPDGEGMPGVLIEAGLCGLPVVATRVAGASTVVDHGRTGLLVPVGDPDALHRAAEELVRQPARRRAMGGAARDRCQQRFAMEAVAARWDEVLRAVPVRSDGRRSSPDATGGLRVAAPGD